MNLTTDKIIETLRDGLTSRNIQTYRIGNPLDFAKSDLPLIYVQALEDRVTQFDNVTDQKEMDFQIGVIIDPSKEFGKSEKGVKEVAGDRFLMEITDGRNSDGTPMTDTIAHLLRDSWSLEGTIFFQEHRTLYGVREQPDAYYKEVHFLVTARAAVARV